MSGEELVEGEIAAGWWHVFIPVEDGIGAERVHLFGRGGGVHVSAPRLCIFPDPGGQGCEIAWVFTGDDRTLQTLDGFLIQKEIELRKFVVDEARVPAFAWRPGDEIIDPGEVIVQRVDRLDGLNFLGFCVGDGGLESSFPAVLLDQGRQFFQQWRA